MFPLSIVASGEHGALEMLRVVVPITHQYVLPVGGLKQSQDAGQDLGVGGALDGFIGFEIHCNHQDGSGLGFPKKEGLVAASGYGEGLEFGQSVGCFMDDEDASMGAIIVCVCLSWITKSMPASDFEVLAHGLVFLLVQMGLDQRINLIVSGPIPVQSILPESRDVGHIQSHVVLGVSGFLWRCTVERWIVIRALWWWQCPVAICLGVIRAAIWMPQTCTICPTS